ncbi:hypothetical protein IE4803_PC00374 (plasmid) [Rhizobium etli bv. phaseoli str. IE4803]|nr:hypothetical protein IE4803_PC00374 [Rhizobium etli bv. phaseoli str. IE4803]
MKIASFSGATPRIGDSVYSLPRTGEVTHDGATIIVTLKKMVNGVEFAREPRERTLRSPDNLALSLASGSAAL